MFGSILMGANEPQTSITSASQYDHQILVFCWYSDTPMESQSREIRCYSVYIEPTGKTVSSSMNINRFLPWLSLIIVLLMIGLGITQYLAGGTMDGGYWAILIVLLTGISGALSIRKSNAQTAKL